jgi:hypothetical protein
MFGDHFAVQWQATDRIMAEVLNSERVVSGERRGADLGANGDRVRVEIPAGQREVGAVDIVELARSFWSRRR